MNNLELEIVLHLNKIIKELYDIDLDIILEVPPKKELWDFCFPTFNLSKILKKSPIQIWQEIINFVNVNNNKYLIFKDLTLFWPYLNFKIDSSVYTDIFIKSLKSKEFVKVYCDKNETIIIDYIWANVWKPLHIWHMCTPNIWQAIINVYRRLWYKVIGDNHWWDWWIIFGKLITAYKLWWDESKLKSDAVDYLLELYVKITELSCKDEKLEQRTRDEFKLLSEWNNESIELWKNFTSYSIKSVDEQLSLLNVKSDFNIWESFFEWLDLPKIEKVPNLKYSMKDIVIELLYNQIASKNEDSSVWVIFSDDLKIPSCVLQKRDWTHGYLASDLACIKYRMENWMPNKIIYFSDSRQQLHFKQAFTIAKMAGWLWNTELFHSYNWFISLKDGAMSTRNWRIIKLDALLLESQVRAKNIILEKRQDLSEIELNELSRIIWIWAIKYAYLSKNRTTDVVFDWDEFMTFEGNSWPYIQYAYVRAIQILKNFDLNYYKNINSWFFVNQEEFDLVKELFNYENILEETAENCYPHILADYSYNLTKKFNSFYNKVHIINEENEDRKKILLSLVSIFAETLKDTFTLLWIDMPERM